MRNYLATALLAFTASAGADSIEWEDWRKKGTDAEKLENVVKSVPSASRIMIEMGERYKNLYWAGKLGYWQFAEYQVEEMESLVKLLQLTRPERAATAEEFLEEGFDDFSDAIEKAEWKPFYQAFSKMREACMVCHVQNDHAFIVLPEHPVTATSPVLNLPAE